jgi:RNA polymerase-binding transcription factor DksA
MGPSDSQRYTRLLLAKRRELSSAPGDARARMPAAGGWGGDVIDRANANADAEAELQIRLHQTDARLLRAIEEAFARIRHVWKQCRGRVSAASARSDRPPDPGKREAMRGYVLVSARW